MVDTHAHLQDPKLQNVEEIVNGAQLAGVNKIVCASCDLETSKTAVEFANAFRGVYATIGYHPHEAKGFDESSINQLKELAQNKKVVAIGEIGLDYFYMFSSKECQKEVFLKQIDLANELKLPIVVHSREETADTLEILRNNRQKLQHGVCIHCFNMSLEILREITSYGFYISIGGIVTFKNANNILQVAKECPSDKFMLETDTPYLTPVPFRSKTNEPKYVVNTAQKIAEIRGLTLEEVDELTTQNANRFFGLGDKKDERN